MYRVARVDEPDGDASLRGEGGWYLRLIDCCITQL